MPFLYCVCVASQDPSPDQHGPAGQATLLLLLLHHWPHHVPGLDPGTQAAGHVHHWRQVAPLRLPWTS